MSLRKVIKYLYAFADGELGETAEAKVRQHVEADPAAARVIEQHRNLRAAVRRDLDAVEVPAGLRDRVLSTLATESRDDSASFEESADAGKTAKPRRRRLITVRRLAIAAVLAIAAGGGWFYQTAQAKALAETIVARHDACCAHCDTHQNAALPERLCPQLAKEIDERFKIEAITPDLSDFGYEFESVNFCGVQFPECTTGGHIIYVKKDGDTERRFSVFSVPRWAKLDKCGGDCTCSDELEPIIVRRADQPDMCIALWCKDGTNYIACGPVAEQQMRDVAGKVRVALADPQIENTFVMLARGGR